MHVDSTQLCPNLHRVLWLNLAMMLINVITVIAATSAAVLLTSNALIFIMGYVCGHYLSQQCIKSAKNDTHPRCPESDYDNLQLETINNKKELELQKNVAYGL